MVEVLLELRHRAEGDVRYTPCWFGPWLTGTVVPRAVELELLVRLRDSFANVPGRRWSFFAFITVRSTGLADRDERPRAPTLMPA